MQTAVRAILSLGALPPSTEISDNLLESFEQRLAEVKVPISDLEALELVKLFGPDDCFGLAWTLLHLIETAPSWPVPGALNGLKGEWAERLRERAA